jgi:cell division protein FtsN
MSYGAALRLGMTGTGTARVDVRVIDVSGEPPAVTTVAYSAPVIPETDGTMLQAGAYGKREGAERLTGQLEQAGINPVSINDAGGLFRVWLGPYASQSEVESVVNQVIELGFERPHRVKR